MHADLTPHPVMRELAWVHRPVSVSLVGNRRQIKVANRRHFMGLEDLVGEWSLHLEGVELDSGTLKVKLGAGTAKTIPLPCDVPSGGEAHLTVRWRTIAATAWCGKGHVVSWDCLPLTPARGKRPLPPVGRARTEVAGVISPRLALWRAPTDNDGMKLAPHLWPMFGKSLRRWLEQGVNSQSPDDLVKHDHTEEIRADGSVLHRHVVVVPKGLDDLPRVGVRFDLPERFSKIRWFGDGPHECYPDRRSSAIASVWETTPDRLPYLVPQEFGLRTNCRWMEFVASDGETLRVTAVGRPLHMSALLHTPEDLYAAPERGLLVERDVLTVHVDVAHRGLGTASCGPDTLPQYRIGHGRHEFAYVISMGATNVRRRKA